MPIESTPQAEPLGTGFLRVTPQWLAGMFGLKATGHARVVLGMIEIEVEGPGIPQGAVIEGTVVPAFVPTGWKATVTP